jgi:hypothetical protein
MSAEKHVHVIEPAYGSISDVAAYSGESEWTVKFKLRDGTYRAKKSGRRTLVSWASVKADLNNLPDAKFAPPRARGKR